MDLADGVSDHFQVHHVFQHQFDDVARVEVGLHVSVGFVPCIKLYLEQQRQLLLKLILNPLVNLNLVLVLDGPLMQLRQRNGHLTLLDDYVLQQVAHLSLDL